MKRPEEDNPESLPGDNKSLAARLGLSDEPSKASPYLRALLAFVKEMPGVGWAVKGTSEALKELAAEEDQKQLERRLFAIGEQTREDIGALAELARVIFLQQNAVLKRLEESGLPAERKRLTEFAIATSLVAYRSRIVCDHQYADHRGIEGGSRTEHIASLPLDEIYVMPRLLPERTRANINNREKDILKVLIDDRDIPIDQRSRLEEEYALLTGERWRPGEKTQEGGDLVGRALQDTRHAVVIGSPGVGKSALIRYLAWVCARGGETMRQRLGWAEEVIPIPISLAAFADARNARPNLTLREFLDERLGPRNDEALRAAIAEELTQGRCFLMFDGIDEIPDSHARVAIVQAVDEFIARHASNRFLVTSRPYGYTRLAGEIAHFQMPNFSTAQVQEFTRRWQRAAERKRHMDSPNLEQAEVEAEALLAEISRNPKVSELATNPLMLVIISLIRYERTRLPEERVQLYDRAVRTLMDTWNQWRSKVAKDVGGLSLPLSQLIPVWGAVAEWTRRNKPTGIVHRAELKRELVRILRDKELDEDNPEATAESYLMAAAHRAGLLEERGPHIFAFWHPTFEEFLAAVELTTPTSKAIRELLPLRDDPRWREVILLAVGHVGIIQHDAETATAIVKAIAEESPGAAEPVHHPYLRLAAACIADDVGVKRTYAQQVIVKLGEIIRVQPYDLLMQSFVDTVRALPRLRPSPEIVSALAPLATHSSWSVRMEATRLFSNVAADNNEALSLCKRLMDDSDIEIKCHAALGLARAGDHSPLVWKALSNFKSHEVYIEPAVREFFTTISDEAKQSLVSLLSSEDMELRYQAAYLLKQMGRADQAIVDTLISLLSDESSDLRYRAAYLLQEMDKVNQAVVDTLISWLSDESSDLRYEATYLLQQMGRANQAVVNTLISWLSDESSGLRYQAAYLLKQMGRADQAIVDTLISLLSDENSFLRYQAAYLLQQMGRADQAVVNTLISWLSDESSGLRYQAAYLLKQMGRADQVVVNTLISLLSDESSGLRYQAAYLLKQMGRADQVVVNTLISLLSDESSDLRYEATYLLQQMGRANQAIVDTLISWLSYEDSFLRSQAAYLLQQMGGTNQAVVETVAKIAVPRPWAALAAWERVVQQQPLSSREGEALAELTRISENDSLAQQQARGILFKWLSENLDPIKRQMQKQQPD